MYNTLIKILEKLKQNTIVKTCIEAMEKINRIGHDMKWRGETAQARKLFNDTKMTLIDKYPIYRQYVSCCLLLEQWDYGHFNTNYDTEVKNFIKKYERNFNHEQKHRTIY